MACNRDALTGLGYAYLDGGKDMAEKLIAWMVGIIVVVVAALVLNEVF